MVASRRLSADPYIASLLQAVSQAARQAGVSLIVMLQDDVGVADDDDWAFDPSLDGLVVSGSALGLQTARIVDVHAKPTVLLGSSHNRGRPGDLERALPLVDVEKRESSASIVEHLFATGCTRIAMISGPTDHEGSQERLAGFRLAHERQDAPIDDDLIIAGDFTRDSGYRIARQILERGPDAIFAANDEMAQGAVLAVSERGLAVPTDLSIAGFDGVGAAIDEPHLTTAEQPFAELAATAIESVLALISGGSVSDRQLIAPRLRLGWSTHAN